MSIGWHRLIAPKRGHRRYAARLMAALVLFVLADGKAAQETRTCVDAKGRTIISDRTGCHQPPLTEDERALLEERKRREMEAYRACKAQQRANDTLLGRYPNKETHDAARAQALAQIEATLRASEAKLKALLLDRKRLLDDAEFYPNGNLPPKLRRDMDSNSALIEAQRLAIGGQNAEAAQKNGFYDEELQKLRTLWTPARGDVKRCVAPQS